jgi:hypothetical protein
VLKKYVKLWIIPLALLAVSLGARRLASACWDSLVHFGAPRFSVEPGGRAEPISRVVLVVVDGLRVDAFDKMEYMSSLRDRAAFYVLSTGQPSLSLPSSAVIATGAWQDVTGVTTNWFEGTVRQDSLFSLARYGGLRAAIVGEEGWGKLFGGQAAETFTRKWKDAYNTFDEETLAKALEFVTESPALLLIHFVDTDMAGHDFGGASVRYRQAAAHIDSLIAGLHRKLEEDTTLIVTSDHGQIDKGGHGGWEGVATHVPFLMCGKTVRPGSYGSAKQTDIAPTVAALLGLPMPPYSEGRILAEALSLGGQQGRLEELLAAQKERFTRAYLGAIGADFEKTRAKIELIPGEDAAHYWERVLAKGKAARISQERVRRLPIFLAILLLPLFAFWYYGRKFRASFRLPLLLSLLYFIIYYGIFFASGKSISLSSVNEEDMLQSFFNQAMLYAAVSAVIAALGLAWLNRKKTAYEAAKSSVVLVAAVDFLLILQVDVFLLGNGPLIGWYIPDMFLAFKYYLDLMSLITVGFVSLIIPLVSLGVHPVGAGRISSQIK